MTIRTISKQHTGGVTKKKDQPEWMTDGPSVGSLQSNWKLKFLPTHCVLDVCLISGARRRYSGPSGS